MKKIIFQLGFIGVVATLAAGCSTMPRQEVYVPWIDVPVAVQSTIQSHQYGGTVSKVEREMSEDGIVYEAKVKGADGTCSEVKVSEAGKLLKYKAKD